VCSHQALRHGQQTKQPVLPVSHLVIASR
jgi:hypothetical protein